MSVTAQRPRAALIALLVVAIAAALGWTGWQHHRHQQATQRAAASKATESLLRDARVQAPLALDLTHTGCYGEGELCVTSAAGREQMTAALKSQLGGLGISTGAPDCHPKDTVPRAGICQLTGHRDGATVIVRMGVHASPYWAAPDWASVGVADPDVVLSVTSGPSQSAKALAKSLVPGSWHASPCASRSGQNCARIPVSATGNVDDLSAGFARHLQALGFGVDPKPGQTSLCAARTGLPRLCVLFAARYYFSGGEHVTYANLTLEQTSTDVATGWIGVTG